MIIKETVFIFTRQKVSTHPEGQEWCVCCCSYTWSNYDMYLMKKSPWNNYQLFWNQQKPLADSGSLFFIYCAHILLLGFFHVTAFQPTTPQQNILIRSEMPLSSVGGNHTMGLWSQPVVIAPLSHQARWSQSRGWGAGGTVSESQPLRGQTSSN